MSNQTIVNNQFLQELCCLSFYLRGTNKPGVIRDIFEALTLLKGNDSHCDITVVDICQIRVEAMSCLYFLLLTTQVRSSSAEPSDSLMPGPSAVTNVMRGDGKAGRSRHLRKFRKQTYEKQISLTLRVVLDSVLLPIEFLCDLMEQLEKWNIVTLNIRHEVIPLSCLSTKLDQQTPICQNIEIKILLPIELSCTIRHLRLLWDSADMVRFYRYIQYTCWKYRGECVIQQNEDLLCCPKTKSLIVFGLNETLIREEVVDELLREVGVDPKAIEESVSFLHCNDKDGSSRMNHDGATSTRDAASSNSSSPSLLSPSYPTRTDDSVGVQEGDPSRSRPTERHEIFEKKLCALEGKDVCFLERALKRISLTENAFFVCRALSLLGYRLALMSQGLDFAANLVGKYLGFEHVLCNRLEVDESGKTLTGKLAGGSGLMDAKFLVDPLRKIDWLQLLRDKLSIPRRNIIVVADVLLMLGLSLSDIRQLRNHLKKQYGSLVDGSCITLDNLYRDLGKSTLSATDIQGWPYFPQAKIENKNSCQTPVAKPKRVGTVHLVPENSTESFFVYKANIYIYGDTSYKALPTLLKCISQCTDHNYKLLTVQQVFMQQAFFLSFVISWNDNLLCSNNTKEERTVPVSSNSTTDVPSGNNELLKNLVFQAILLSLKIKFAVTLDNDDNFIAALDSHVVEYDVTLVRDPHLTVELLAAIFTKMAAQGLSILEMAQMTDSSNRFIQCIQTRVSQTPLSSEDATDNHALQKTFLKNLKSELLTCCQDHRCDVAVQRRDVLRFCRRLVVFDMDSTLIQEEVIDELAKCAGVEKEVAALTEKAMRGELDFFQSLKARVKMLKGMPSSKLDEVEALIHFTPGAQRLCSLLRLLGFRLAVVSGGFTRFARYVKRGLGLHHAFANTLEVDPENGVLTGEVVGPVVTPQRKAAILQMLAELERCSTEQVIAVGDGANDIAMLMKAGMGVAFCAKPKVQESAEFRINHKDLGSLLFLMGISNEAADHLQRAHRSNFVYSQRSHEYHSKSPSTDKHSEESQSELEKDPSNTIKELSTSKIQSDDGSNKHNYTTHQHLSHYHKKEEIIPPCHNDELSPTINGEQLYPLPLTQDLWRRHLKKHLRQIG